MMKNYVTFMSILISGLLYSGLAGGQECPKPERQPATKALMELVANDDVLRQSLTESIALGQEINSDPQTNPVASIDDYYDFIDALITYDPRNINTGLQHSGVRISMDGANYCNWNILDILAYSYFLVDRQISTDPRGQIQFANLKFSKWMRQVAEEWGKYLETPDSARYVPNFTSDPFFGAWYCPSAPYPTFQDFFTRELCAEEFPTCSRPVAGYDDPLTVVSVADSNTLGTWPISINGKLVTGYDGISQSGLPIKGQLYNDIHTFITGGAGETILKTFGELDPARFNGGTFSHQFLNVNNYHRLHVPVAGKLVYMRHIQSGVRMKSGWKPPLNKDDVGYYAPLDTPDWQFGQTRLVLGIETPDHGVVLAVPMGMAQVAAIELREWVKKDAKVDKGWEFANFAFGGSDFVVIFESKAGFVLTVPQMAEPSPGAGVNYEPSKQGERYGCLGGKDTCSTASKPPSPYPGCGTSLIRSKTDPTLCMGVKHNLSEGANVQLYNCFATDVHKNWRIKTSEKRVCQTGEDDVPYCIGFRSGSTDAIVSGEDSGQHNQQWLYDSQDRKFHGHDATLCLDVENQSPDSQLKLTRCEDWKQYQEWVIWQ